MERPSSKALTDATDAVTAAALAARGGGATLARADRVLLCIRLSSLHYFKILI